ncbi:MAG: hypothetical protein IT357_10905 [Gemmatimonadaceae bacterium]|jgi:hypothetical protein|nr:hypothetical protein [Gemmatimonadaceae bacterium]
MLRTVFIIGLLAFAGLFALKILFGIMGTLFGLIFWLLGMAIPVLIIGLMVYVVIRIFAPETAKDLRSKFGGE